MKFSVLVRIPILVLASVGNGKINWENSTRREFIHRELGRKKRRREFLKDSICFKFPGKTECRLFSAET